MASAQTDIARYQLHVGGERVPALSGATFEVENPATGQVWARFAEAGSEDVDRAVGKASEAFRRDAWRSLSPTKRGRLLMRLGERIGEHAERLAELETLQNGKLLKEMLSQLRTVPEWFYYYGGLADKVEGRVIPLDRRDVLNYTLHEPLGVVGVITPWNSPTLLTTMALAPALAAGNAVVIKPSEVTPAALIELAALADEVGFPPGIVNVITGSREAGERLAAHPDVAKVAFTGGTATGKTIAATVGGRLGRYVLELGGKSPNIVFADADLDAVEAGVLAGIFAAGGQTCVAGSRLLVEESVHDELLERLIRRARDIKLGDPTHPATQMGPVATRPQLERIATFVEEARSAGATVVAGGGPGRVQELPNGLFFQPTVVCGLEAESALWQDEVFGPVLAVATFDDEEHAVARANASRYGLAAGVWTTNIKRAHRIARALEAGTVWVNLYRALAFNSPFGGYKESGIGRANGSDAIHEYLQVKSVWCELGEEIQDPFVLKL